ncbi:MAG: mechanosensitive ion channel family protein [Acetivibrionales bacterium]|jgi:MscS family membrane protein
MSFWDIFSLMRMFYYRYEILVRIAIALGILIIAILLRRFFINVIIKLLKKATKKTKTDFDDQLLSVIEKPARFALMVIGIFIAVKTLPLGPELSIKVGVFLDKTLKTLIMLSLFWAGYRAAELLTVFLRRLVERSGSKLDDSLSAFIGNAIKIIILIIGSITILQIWVKDIAGILTGLGLGGLAFALAAQDTAANLFGSVTIMLDKPFGIGDWIMTPHVEGTVEEIGFRSTKVRTFAQALVTIPNSTMSKDPITNWSRMGKRRINFRLGVTYNTTNEQMKECVKRFRNMLENHPGIHPETIFVYFERFGENSLDIFIYMFTITTVWKEFLEVQEDVNLKIIEIIRELGLEIALPSRRIFSPDEKSNDGITVKQPKK